MSKLPWLLSKATLAALVASSALFAGSVASDLNALRGNTVVQVIVGLKPSRGRITYGPDDVDVWFGSVSFFTLTRTVRDTAAFLDATAGNLPGDPYTLSPPPKAWLAAL